MSNMSNVSQTTVAPTEIKSDRKAILVEDLPESAWEAIKNVKYPEGHGHLDELMELLPSRSLES